MALDTNTFGDVRTVDIDTAQTIGLFRLPGGSIDRTHTFQFLSETGDSYDYQIDIGVVPNDVDVSSESDIRWFGDVSSGTVDSDVIDTVETPARYVRVVITTIGTADSTAKVAAELGR